MFTTKPVACVVVISDLVTDQRVLKTCNLLVKQGYTVHLIGREIPQALPLNTTWPFNAKRIKIPFSKGPLMYICFAWALALHLQRIKPQLVIANDLDTLWPSIIAKRKWGSYVIYDSHEYFCEVPELQHRPFKKAIWKMLERRLIHKTDARITVSDSIAKAYAAEYNLTFNVVRNVPESNTDGAHLKPRAALGMPESQTILILQGSGINPGRGAEELIKAMYELPEMVLYIIGSGDSWQNILNLASDKTLKNRVRCISRISKTELQSYTAAADIGISIDKPTNLNYKYSLPNKIFDYLQAGLPVLVSRIPELENLLNEFPCGVFIENHNPRHIAEQIKILAHHPNLDQFKMQSKRAAQKYTWNTEQEVWLKLLSAVKYNNM